MRIAAALFLVAASVALARADVWSDYLDGAQLYNKKEYAAAYPVLLRAAQAGDARAQYMIAQMYQAGHPVKPDATAAEWYRKAADQGHPVAQMALAMLLHRGTELPVDRFAAYQWASLAADRMDGQLRETALILAGAMANFLTEAERERARAAVAAWRPHLARVDGGSTGPVRVLWTGTGFFVNATGTLLTNAHVAYLCPQLVVFDGDSPVEGAVLNVDFGADLATVQTGLRRSSVARFAGQLRPKPGIPITVVGYALKRTTVRRPLSSAGTILDASPAGGNVPWYQTSVPIYPGQSGAPVLDETGQVIGVARGVFDGRTDDSSQHTIIVGAESIHRFLRMTKTSFEKADVDSSARPASPADFTALLQCSSS